MLVFFSSLIGLLSSLIPFAIKIFYLYKTQNYNLANFESKFDLLKALIKNNSKTQFQKLLQYPNHESPYRVEQSNYIKYNTIIRTIFAFLFLAIYVYIKYILWCSVKNESIKVIYQYLWTSDDAIMFSMIIGFYFGSKLIYSYF